MACNSGFQTRFPTASPEAGFLCRTHGEKKERERPEATRRPKEQGARPSAQIQLGNVLLSDYRFYFEVLHTISLSKELPILHFFNS